MRCVGQWICRFSGARRHRALSCPAEGCNVQTYLAVEAAVSRSRLRSMTVSSVGMAGLPVSALEPTGRARRKCRVNLDSPAADRPELYLATERGPWPHDATFSRTGHASLSGLSELCEVSSWVAKDFAKSQAGLRRTLRSLKLGCEGLCEVSTHFASRCWTTDDCCPRVSVVTTGC